MRHLAVVPLVAVLAAACSSSPTGPDDETPAEWFYKIEVSNIAVMEMCDGFPVDIDGGEWSHVLQVRFPGETAFDIGGTANYPSAASYRNAGRGDLLYLDPAARNQGRVRVSEEGDRVVLTIRATEWDFDIFGNNAFPDSRMNNRSAAATFTFTDGEWPQEPNGTLILQNTGSCEVRVSYKFEAEKQ